MDVALWRGVETPIDRTGDILVGGDCMLGCRVERFVAPVGNLKFAGRVLFRSSLSDCRRESEKKRDCKLVGLLRI